MSVVRARSLDISAVVMVSVMVVVMPYFLQAGVMVRMRVSMWMRIAVRISYASVFDIPRADVDVTDFSTKTTFRSVYKMACCIRLPAYVG